MNTIVNKFPAEPSDFERLGLGYVLHDFKIGDVALVRSDRLPGFGTHWVIVTGGLVQKPWGLRPETVHYSAPELDWITEAFQPDNRGVVWLQLKNPKRFYEFHGIEVVDGKVIFHKGGNDERN